MKSCTAQMAHTITEYEKSNREKRLTPKHGLFWCGKCDRQIVGKGEKCPNCGHRPMRKQLKKETNAR